MTEKIDILIPARAGSTGLPGKNRRVLVDRPLFLHSVACAQMLQNVGRILVSTDDADLAAIAKGAGAFVPALRPGSLAANDTPMADVIRHAVQLLEADDATAPLLLLLDPTSPLREPSAIDEAVDWLYAEPLAAGVVSISVPSFNPLWVGVVLEDDGHLHRHPLTGGTYTRRQDVPPYWRINGSFYVWRKSFAATITPDWPNHGGLLGYETPELLSHSIDTEDDFRLVEALITAGLVRPRWMEEADV